MRKMKGVEMIKLERTADHIEKTLREAFNPQELEVSDVSGSPSRALRVSRGRGKSL
jgi:stress-induced morphogen